MRTWSTLAQKGALGEAREFSDGEVILQRDEPAEAAYYLASGHVEILQSTHDGRSMVVRVLCAPCLFGVIEACGDQPRNLETARALKHAAVHVVPLPEFHRVLSSQRLAALECLAATARAFGHAAITEAARLVETEVLLSAMLVLWAEEFGKDGPQGRVIKLQRTQRQMADAVGTSERHVQRLISAWRARGFIAQERGRWVLCDTAFFKNLAAGYEHGLLSRALPLPLWAGGA